VDSGKVLALRFSSDPRRLKVVRARVTEAAESCGCGTKLTSELVIAINEACMNIMQHAYKGDCSREIVLEILNNGDELEFKLTDFAEPVDATQIASRDLDEVRPGGLGTYFMQQLMDECAYGHLDEGKGNFLRMKKKIS
jgi:anti-sigma regulatory factor (Ser/Thr protein kinase)